MTGSTRRMRRARAAAALIIGATVLTAGQVVAPRAAGQTIRWSHYLPAGHPILKTVLIPWFVAIAKATDRRVTVSFKRARWAPAPRQIEVVEQNNRYAALGGIGFTPRRFQVARIAELPFLSDSAEALSLAYWRVHQRHLAKAGEFAKVHLLALAAEAPGDLWSTDKPIVRLAELRGTPLLVLGATPETVARRLGAAPLLMPPPLAGEVVAAGRARAFLGMAGTARRRALIPRLDKRTHVPGGLYANAYFVAIASAIWRRIAPRDRDAIMAVSGTRLARALGAAWDRENAHGTLAAAGVQTTRVDGQFADALKARLAVIETRWLTAAKAKGVDGPAALRFLRAEIAREKSALRHKDLE